jgi:hypothetical protein
MAGENCEDGSRGIADVDRPGVGELLRDGLEKLI